MTLKQALKYIKMPVSDGRPHMNYYELPNEQRRRQEETDSLVRQEFKLKGHYKRPKSYRN